MGRADHFAEHKDRSVIKRNGNSMQSNGWKEGGITNKVHWIDQWPR